MDEEMLSVISSGGDSDSTGRHPPNKRKRGGSNGGSSRFKGVMRQKNGQWGAQLYTNHSRIWLGTFKSETEAAMAYDSAAIKFRTGENHRNLPWNNTTLEEPRFQSYHSAEYVLRMIRDGSYQQKFADFLNAESRRETVQIDFNSVGPYSVNGLTGKLMFQKDLSPSDVSKLNRLVIPKKYAVKFFPTITENSKENVRGGNSTRKMNDVELTFYDNCMKLWKFRYCYWHSSQSCVFTRGWNVFLREKQLKAHDVVSFYACESPKGHEVQRFWMIDVNKTVHENPLVQAANLQVGKEVDLQLRLGHSLASAGEKRVKKEPEFMEVMMPKQVVVKQEPDLMAAEPPRNGVNTKGFKLFGKYIIID